MRRHLGARFGTAVLAGALLWIGCSPPKYVRYTSKFGDFSCEVPWGWNVVLDPSGSDYVNVTFTGPLDPDFFRGVPSLSVRWYRYNAAHRLPDGTYELYSSIDDFTRQMLRDVYGSSAQAWAGADKELQKSINENSLLPKYQNIRVSGQEASYFVVYRTLPAPKEKVYGVIKDEAGQRAVLQRHAYVLIATQRGFYVLIYPATRDGFEKYRPAFFHLINTLHLLKEGPGGPVPRS